MSFIRRYVYQVSNLNNIFACVLIITFCKSIRAKDFKIILRRIMSISGGRSSDEGFLRASSWKHCTMHRQYVRRTKSGRTNFRHTDSPQLNASYLKVMTFWYQEFRLRIRNLTLKSYEVETSIFTYPYICRCIKCTSNAREILISS